MYKMNNETFLTKTRNGMNVYIPFFLLLFFVTLFNVNMLEGGGIQDAAPSPTDVVWLNIGDNNFGNFAAYGSAGTTSGLAIEVKAGECIYIGLSSGSVNSAVTDFLDDYNFRITNAGGTVLHGPFLVNQGNQNVSSWGQGGGPTELGVAGGYSVATMQNGQQMYKFCPPSAGTYYIEFQDNPAAATFRIPLWDFTVGLPPGGGGPSIVPGRIYSQNWSFRTPPDGLAAGNICNFFQRPFNGALYSYTTDGFVSKIDFQNSGLRGLTFNVAFNTVGPGTSGVNAMDRMSVENANATGSAAEHKIFLSPPDPTCFPDGACGEITVIGLTCTPGGYCINFNLTQPGDLEIILDFNGNGIYDAGTADVLFVESLSSAGDQCVIWDGIKGDGTSFGPGESVTAAFQFTQGIQHYSAYDVEYLTEGFCIETVRPAGCPTNNQLYWDDTTINSASGTGQPNDGTAGCVCQTAGCRTWDNFLACGGGTTSPGYGNFNTLNTWWFAFVAERQEITLQLDECVIDGPEEVCVGEELVVEVITEPGFAYTYSWADPNNDTGDNAMYTVPSATIADAGEYCVTLTTSDGCTSSCCITVVVNTLPICDVTSTIGASGPDEMDGSFDFNITGVASPYDYTITDDNGAIITMGTAINGSNVIIPSLAEGTYTVAIVDENGCNSVCEVIIGFADVTIAKEVTISPAPTGNPNEFTIEYTLTVSNDGTTPGTYDLTDTLKYGLGASVISATGMYVGGGTETQTGTDNTGMFDGQADYLLGSDEMIAVGVTEDWTVTVIFTVDPGTVTSTSADCTLDMGEGGTGLLNCAAVSNGVPDDTADACEPIPVPEVSISKSVTSTPAPTGNPNEFTIEYTITIENTGTVVAFYDLTDTLKYGVGASVISATGMYVGGGTETQTGTDNTGLFDGQADYLLGSDEMIAVGVTEDWTVTVIFTVDPGTVTSTSADCTLDMGEGGTGLLNCAAVSNGVPDDTADACEPIPVPEVSISKSVTSTPAPTGNPNEFTIEYTITIENTGTVVAFYDLTDTLKYGLGASVISATGMYVGGGAETQTGTDNTGMFDGQADYLLGSDEMIAVGVTEDWTVTVIFTVDPGTVTSTSADCTLDMGEGGTGLLNCAAVSNGVPDDTADACEPIPVPEVSISKAVTSTPAPTGNPNEFTIEYTITIENTGTVVAFYDLTDTLKYGVGASVISATGMYVGGGAETQTGTDNTGLFDGQADYLLGSDEMIAVGVTEDWTVTVIFTVDPGTVTSTSADCTLDMGEGGTGLLNCAAVSNGVPDDTADACVPIPLPSVSISKIISSSASPTGNLNEFTIEYTVTVENTGNSKAFYDLTDTLKFGSGATVVDADATYVLAGTETQSGIDNSATFDGVGNYLISDDEMIEVGQSESWIVAATFVVVPEMITGGSGNCVLETGETVTGLLNCATVSDGVPSATDDACEPIPVPSVSLSKAVTSAPMPTGNPNEFSITYTITIENTSETKAFYDLTDTLKYGAGATIMMATAVHIPIGTETFSGVDNTATFDGVGNNLISDDEMIEAAAKEEWEVTVVFVVDPQQVSEGSGNCQLETGETVTGLLNCAAVGDGVPDATDDACAPIPLPSVSIDKVISSTSTPTGNANEFSIEYTISITNTSDAKAFYDLTDTLKYGLGAQVISATASYIGGGTENLSGVDNTAAFDGVANFLISDNEMIEAGVSEDWLVSVVYLLTPGNVTPTSGDCTLDAGEAGTGLLNCAAVSDGVPNATDDACEPLAMPAVSVSKSITNSALPTGNPNEFEIEYTIVTWNTGDAVAFYDLSDMIKFGDGTTVLDATIQYIPLGDETSTGADNSPSFDGESNFLIVDNEMLAIGATESWTVTVLFTVDPTMVTGESSNCILESGEMATGLLNCAVVGGDVPTAMDDACEPVPMPAVSVSKTISTSSSPAGSPNVFDLAYTITVSNTGDAKAFYDLSDTLKFGAGATVLSSSATYIGGGTENQSGIDNSASFNGESNHLISDNEMIEIGASEDWLIEVQYIVDPELLTGESSNCTLESGESVTGLLNCATVSGDVPSATDDACEPIPSPAVSISKAISSSALPTGNPNEFTISYEITVTNTGDAKAFYDLTDTLKYGSGATVVDANVNYIGGGTEDLSGINNTASYDGLADYLISDNEMIELGAVEVWEVVVIFTVDVEMIIDGSANCMLEMGETGTGLLNCASVSDGVPDATDDACEPLPVPAVEITKAVTSSAAPTGNPNEFTIEYTITIENIGDAKAFYDLTDTLKYGVGASVVSASAAYIGGGTEDLSGMDNTGSYDGVADYLLSGSEMIEIGATEDWTVTVVFTVDPNVVTSTSADCSLDMGEAGTGLLNCAAVSNGVPDDTADICEPLPVPAVEISKAITSSAAPTGNPNEFTIEYTITIENTGDAKAFYDLTDTLKYGVGSSIVSASAAYVGGGTEDLSGMDNTGSYDGVADYLLSGSEMIEIGATEDWTVTVIFTIDPNMVSATSADCSLDMGEAGTGLLNCAAVSNGVPDATADVCEPLPVPAVEISKAITSSAAPTGNPNEFTIEYTITIENTGDAKAFYDLTDTLKYGVGASVVSASAAYVGGGTEDLSGMDNTGSYDGVADYLLSGSEMIEIGATEDWTVTVVFTVDPNVVTSTSADCSLDMGEAGTGLLNCAAVSNGVPDATADVCEPLPVPAVEISKAITSSAAPTGNPNEFTIEYTITIENTGDAKAFYDLTDTLKYGVGASIVSASAAYVGGGTEDLSGMDNTGSYDGVADYLLSGSEMIEIGATEDWTVTVIFTIDPNMVSATSADCTLDMGEAGTGLLNCAAVSNGVPDATADVCEPLPMPAVEISKSISSSASPTGNPNEFTIEYTITIENTGDAKAFYDLTDTLKYGEGASVISASAAYVGGGAEDLSGTDNTASFDGVADYLLSSDEMVEIGATEDWTVTVIFTIDPSMVSATSADCSLDMGEAGTGLLNCAAVSNGVPDATADVCEPLPMPAVEISKSISSSASPTGNPNEFTIEYTITIENTGDAKAFYDLTDTLKYGEGASVVSASAAYIGGGTEDLSGTDNTASFDGVADYLLSSDEMIEIGATEDWTVTVIFTIDPNIVSSTSADCSLDMGEAGTGLLNCAAVSNGVPDATADVCEPLPMPAVEISKSISSSASPTGNPNEFTIEYTITIENTGDAKAFYDLTDTLKYGIGSTIVNASAAYVGGGVEDLSGMDNTGSYDGVADYLISGNEMIEVGATEDWTVTVVFTIDPNAITSASADCSLDMGESGTGLLNCASVSNGVPDDTADACEPLPMPAVEISKAITSSASPTGNPNEFEIEYTITIENTGDAKAFYNLTDTLKYGIGSTIVNTSAAYVGGGVEDLSGMDNTGSYDGVADYLISGNEMIEVGATEDWTVTVVFTIDPNAITSASADCSLDMGETGTGLLNCAAVSNGVPDDTADACEPLPMPAVEVFKRVTQEPLPTGNVNEFEIKYLVTVNSVGDAKAFYDLADTLKFGTGATIIDVNALYLGGGTEMNNGIDNTTSFDGTSNFLLTDNEMLEVDAFEEWEVAVIFIVDPLTTTMTSGDCTIDAGETGTGLLNCAGVSDGVPEMSADACTTIPMLSVEITKLISSPVTWTGNPFEYTISYNVMVENSGDNKAFYDLNDTLKYGAGANIVSVDVIYIPGNDETISGTDNSASFDGTTDFLLTDNEMIEVSGIESWQIDVVFSVDLNQVTAESENCDLIAGETGTGLLNCAGVSDAVPEDSDDACESIPLVPAVDLVKDIADIQTAASGVLGNVDLTIDFQITNIGNTDIINLSLIDDIVSEFGPAFVQVVGIPTLGAGTATMLPTINSGYTGTSPDLDMFVGFDGFLMRDEFFTIQIMVEIDPNAPGIPDPLENQATVSGTPIDGTGNEVNDPVTGEPEVTDESDSGTMPDDTNPGEPGDEGTTDDPTEIRVPLIATVKSLIEYLPANSGEDGHLDIVMELAVKNIGNVPLNNLSLIDDMTTAIPAGFGGIFESIVYDGTYPFITPATTAVMPGGLNPAFDGGILDAEIFDGTGVVDPNEEIYVQIRIELDVSDDVGVAIPDTIYNLATASGDYTDPNSNETTTVEDDSDSGTDFEGTNPDEPGDEGTPDDPTPVPLLGKLGDFIWNDCNGNGIQDLGEVGIANVTIELFDGMGTFVKSVVTDANGMYIINGILPGDYYVKMIVPGDFEITFPKEGANEELDSDFTNFFGPGTTNLQYIGPASCEITSFDGGLYQCVPIGDLVWYDNDEDDIFDSTENGINGLKINLYRQINGGTEFELWDFDFTDLKPGTPSDDGYYKFCAPPGTYYLEIGSILNGLVPAQENIGSNEEIDSDITNEFGPNTTDAFAVVCGTDKCDLGAGFYLMGTAGDFVWRDDNGNGQQESWEPRLENITIQARDITGDIIATAVTDADGFYEVDYLQKEDYYFKVITPSGLAPTIPNIGNDDSDSDIDNSNGINTTGLYTMVPGEHIPSIDVGLVFGTLPVEFTAFDGYKKGEYNFLYWTTATEINNDRFEVERRFEREEFVKIGEVNGAGTVYDERNYDFKDYDINLAGVYYYRLKQVDLDGNYKYSGIIAIRIESDEKASISVFPNPTIEEVNIKLEAWKISDLDLEIQIFDSASKLVETRTVDAAYVKGNSVVKLDLSSLIQGTYMIKLIQGQEIFEQKIIKLD